MNLNGQSQTWATGLTSTTGNLTVSNSGAAGTLTLTGSATYTGCTTIANANTTLQIGNGTAITFGGTGNITDNGVLLCNSTANIAISGIISGNGSLTKQNADTLLLSGLNTFSGGTNFNDVADPGGGGATGETNVIELGSSSHTTTANGTTTMLNGPLGTGTLYINSANLTFAEGVNNPLPDMWLEDNGTPITISNPIAINFPQNGAVGFESTNQATGSLTIDPQGTGNGMTITGPFNWITNNNLIVNENISSPQTGNVAGNSAGMPNFRSGTGTGTLTLGGNNTFTQMFPLNTLMTLILGSSTRDSTGAVTAITTNIASGPLGTLSNMGNLTAWQTENDDMYATAGEEAVAYGFLLGNGTIGLTYNIYDNGSNLTEAYNLGLYDPFWLAPADAANVNFGSTGNGSLTWSGVISGPIAGNETVTKSTAGTLTLSGANTYIGGTTVNAGTLAVNNTTGSATGTAAVTANGTLQGSGTASTSNIAGALVTVNGNGTIASTGVKMGLTLNNGLTLAAGAKCSFTLGTPTGTGAGNELINIAAGVFTATNTNTITLTAGTGIATGTYELFSYTALADAPFSPTSLARPAS